METPPRTWGRLVSPCQNPQIYEKHPHARGEDPRRRVGSGRVLETPPRTWGRLASLGRRFRMGRNTPTHVGKTPCGIRKARPRRKHPHARGEDLRDQWGKWLAEETPPRTWGRLRGDALARLRDRNTPTHVGKTMYRAYNNLLLLEETPPRTWGRHDKLHLIGVGERNTPTHVGKTASLEFLHFQLPKHPHARGEDLGGVTFNPLLMETPPRTWGRPQLSDALAFSNGNTPTHVGKTLSPGGSDLVIRKHPHARGEDLSIQNGINSTLETPPRTWGRLEKNIGG